MVAFVFYPRDWATMTLTELSFSDLPYFYASEKQTKLDVGCQSSPQVVVIMCSEFHTVTLCKQVLILSCT